MQACHSSMAFLHLISQLSYLSLPISLIIHYAVQGNTLCFPFSYYFSYCLDDYYVTITSQNDLISSKPVISISHDVIPLVSLHNFLSYVMYDVTSRSVPQITDLVSIMLFLYRWWCNCGPIWTSWKYDEEGGHVFYIRQPFGAFSVFLSLSFFTTFGHTLLCTALLSLFFT